MSTPQSIPRVTHRLRIGLGTLMTALGVLIAIAVAIIILALTGANHTTMAPATASQAAGGSTPHTQYLGPRQMQATPNPQSGAGSTPATGVGNPPPHYTCLGAAQGCHR